MSLLIIFTCIFCMLSSPWFSRNQPNTKRMPLWLGIFGCFIPGPLRMRLPLGCILVNARGSVRMGSINWDGIDGVSSDRVDLTSKNAATGIWQQPIPRDPCRALQPLFCHAMGGYAVICHWSLGAFPYVSHHVSLQPIHCWSHQWNPLLF